MKLASILLSTALCTLFVLPPSFASQLPDLGSDFRGVMTVKNEQLMGNHFMGQIRASGLVYGDPLINEYIRHLGYQLTPYTQMPYANMQIKFFVLNDKAVNAFAFPGGHIAVHSGLILLTASESELAGVMAHELAHISQQHLLRQQADSQRMMPVTVAGSIAAAALGVPELLFPVFAGHMQIMLNYSRQHEQEADRIGIQILAKANFDPHGLPQILERMSSDMRFENKPPEYLVSHPLFESRISDTRHRADNLSYRKRTNPIMFELIKARIAVQTNTNLQKLLSECEHQLRTKGNNSLGTRYKYAYALNEKGKTQQALQLITALLQEYPEDMILNITAAELEIQNNQMSQARKRLEQLLALYPDSNSVLANYIDLLVQTKQPHLAKKMLTKYKAQHSLDPIYYEFVRQIEGMLGNKAAVYEANAEWYLLHADVGSSLAQFDLALAEKSLDQKSKSRLKARQKQVVELQQELKKI